MTIVCIVIVVDTSIILLLFLYNSVIYIIFLQVEQI